MTAVPLFRYPGAGRFNPQSLRLTPTALPASLAFFGQDSPVALLPAASLTFTPLPPQAAELMPAASLTFTPLLPSAGVGVELPAQALPIAAWPPSVEAVNPHLHDTLGYRESLTESSERTIRDRLELRDGVSGVLHLSAALADTLRFRDVSRGRLTGLIADSLRITDTLSSTQSASIQDNLEMREVVGGPLRLSALIIETFGVLDAARGLVCSVTQDTLTLVEQASGQVRLSAIAADRLDLTETLSGHLTAYLVATDRLGLQAVSAGKLRLSAITTDVSALQDRLIVDPIPRIVVTNLETGAVSTYAIPSALVSLAQFDGALYLAGPDGLYALDAEQDDAGPINWQMQTGFSNLGTDFLKRIRDVSLQLRNTGIIELAVTSDRQGIKQAHRYPLALLPRVDYRDGVIKIGQGIQSVYYQMGLFGVGPVELDQLRVNLELLSRRR